MRAIKNVTSSWNWPNLSASNCCTCPPTRPTSISSNACGNSSRRIVCTRPITTTLRSSNRPSHPVSLKLKPHTGPPSTPCFPTASRPSKNQKLCHGRVYLQSPLEYVRASPRHPGEIEAFRSINPNALVPVLEDGSSTVWETDAIACRLSEMAGSDFWRTGPDIAEMIMWVSWSAYHLTRAADPLYFYRVVAPTFTDEKPNPAILEQALSDFREH